MRGQRKRITDNYRSEVDRVKIKPDMIGELNEKKQP